MDIHPFKIRRNYIGMDIKRIEEISKMPQIWLKRRKYDELTIKGYAVEKKVDELVEEFLEENEDVDS